jgi:hypothetical protein
MQPFPSNSINPLSRIVAGLACALSLGAASAGVVDAVGDYVAGFGGSTAGDLDVLSASVVYRPTAHLFTLEGTMAANIGSSAGGFYVYGVDRGQGTARFAANGITGVLFDMVVIINADGSGRVNDLVGGLPAFVFGAGFAHISGPSFSLDLDDSHLPSRGFASAAYTWNLWPRDGTQPTGFRQISDFAPDNSNFATTVPEPASLALAALGMAALLGVRRRAR